MKWTNVIVIAWMLFFGVGYKCFGDDAAVSINPSTSTTAQGSVAGSNQGWQFTVNQNIIVTHLGMYDGWPDGFSIDHPIGLWRLNDGTLLASGTISAGTVDPLTNNFRYIDVPDVQLSVGVNYVIII